MLKLSFHFHQSSPVVFTLLYITKKLAIWKHEIVSINHGIPPLAHFFGRRILLLINFDVIRLFERAISTKRRDFRLIRDFGKGAPVGSVSNSKWTVHPYFICLALLIWAAVNLGGGFGSSKKALRLAIRDWAFVRIVLFDGQSRQFTYHTVGLQRSA